MTELVDAYGCRIIEGIDKKDVLDALTEKSDSVFTANNSGKYGAQTNSCYISLVNKTTQRYVWLNCTKNYFEPSKTYYKLSDASPCSFVRKAMGLSDQMPTTCGACFLHCLRNRKIKKSHKIIKSVF